MAREGHQDNADALAELASQFSQAGAGEIGGAALGPPPVIEGGGEEGVNELPAVHMQIDGASGAVTSQIDRTHAPRPRGMTVGERARQQRLGGRGYAPAPPEQPTYADYVPNPMAQPAGAPAAYLDVVGVDLKKGLVVTSMGVIPIPVQTFTRIQSEVLKVVRQFYANSLAEANRAIRPARKRRRRTAKKTVQSVSGGEGT